MITIKQLINNGYDFEQLENSKLYYKKFDGFNLVIYFNNNEIERFGIVGDFKSNLLIYNTRYSLSDIEVVCKNMYNSIKIKT